jgi:hypothetical protein
MRPQMRKGRLGVTRDVRTMLGRPYSRPLVLYRVLQRWAHRYLLASPRYLPPGGWGPVGCIMRFPGHMEKNLECAG